MTARVQLGRLTGVFGVRGEVKCLPSPQGEAAFAPGKSFVARHAADEQMLTCSGVRRHHGRLLLAFAEIATPEAARTVVGCDILGEPGSLDLAPHEYLDADLVGLTLIDTAGEPCGTVSGVRHFPAQDCLVVGARGSLVPMVKAFIKRIDLDARTIVVDLPAGLLED